MSEVQNQELLINHNRYETRVAVVENGVVEDLFVERAKRRGMVGNIYKGRIRRVLTGMDAAFIDIGSERTAFLHIKNIAQAPEGASIDDVVHEGQTLLVQVLKDPIGSKGARLSTNISIPSRFLVFLPNSADIGVSTKIESEVQRRQLREAMEDIHKGQQGGFIVRTAIETADFWAMRADMQYLQRLWERIRQHYLEVAAGTLVYEDLPLFLKVLRDFVNAATAQIVVDDAGAFDKMCVFANDFLPGLQERLVHYQGQRPLFDLYGVDEELNQALERRVNLKSGGYLMIDQTEAMTTIDVNTGAFVGRHCHEDTIYKTNLEAAQAIARQLRLRNLGGIILLDFIDMADEQHRFAVFQTLLEALSDDRTKYTISQISSLGLVEMTRKRTHDSLRDVMCEPCSCCDGRGYAKTLETIAYEIFRDVERDAKQFTPQAMTVIAAAEVVDYVLEEESLTLADLQRDLNLTLRFVADSAYKRKQYDICVS